MREGRGGGGWGSREGICMCVSLYTIDIYIFMHIRLCKNIVWDVLLQSTDDLIE